jgi:hypothetical protein
MLRHLASGFAVAGLACLVACSTDDANDSSAREDLIETSAPIKPVDLLRCHVVPDTSTSDPFFQSHELRCGRVVQSTYPLVQQRALVEVITAKSRGLTGDITGDDEVRVGFLRNDDFPLRVRTRLMFPETATVGSQFALKREDAIANLTAATKEKPLVFTSPFTLWGVAMRTADARALFLSTQYDVPTDGYKVGWNFATPDGDPSTLPVHSFQNARDGKVEIAFIAPPSGRITLRLASGEVTLTGPGSYVVEGTTLRKEAPATPSGPGAVEPAPAPTCGTDGQAKCPDGTCAPAHRLDSGTCRACGTAGKTFCWDSSKNERYCAPAHRLDSEICLPCGKDGETFCYDRSTSSRVCEPKHRIVGDKCAACGTNGKTYCYDSRTNTRFCEPSHRIVNELCTSCGAEGQTYCYDSATNRRYCNSGLRLANETCVR